MMNTKSSERLESYVIYRNPSDSPDSSAVVEAEIVRGAA